MKTPRAYVIPLITLLILTALSAMAAPAMADGGDFSLDFIAAGPFTYDHDTGEGGEFADRTISRTEGVVESLEGGDFACGDKVVYFTEITVDDGASGEQDIELDYEFLAEPTGQPGVGQTELVEASPNTGDSGMSGATSDTTVSVVGTPSIDSTPPPPKDTLQASIRVSNLDPGEVFILRIVVLLECIPGSDPTGNLQAAIVDADVVAPEADAIGVGNQTIPFKNVDEIVEAATVDVSVGACPEPGSDTRPVDVDISPSGSAVVTVTGPGGPYVVTGSGDTLDLEPGTYSWTAVARPGFELDGPASGRFTVADCPPSEPPVTTPVTVTVIVGACPAGSSATRPVNVVIDPDGGASVTITGPNGAVEVGSGATLELAEGTYSWTAAASPSYRLVGGNAGSFDVTSCVVEVLPRTFLPKTGVSLPALGATGFAFLFLGAALVMLSRRPAPGLAFAFGPMIMAGRLRGRTVWLPAWTGWTLRTPARRIAKGAIPKRPFSARSNAPPGG